MSLPLIGDKHKKVMNKIDVDAERGFLMVLRKIGVENAYSQMIKYHVHLHSCTFSLVEASTAN